MEKINLNKKIKRFLIILGFLVSIILFVTNPLVAQIEMIASVPIDTSNTYDTANKDGFGILLTFIVIVSGFIIPYLIDYFINYLSQREYNLSVKQLNLTTKKQSNKNSNTKNLLFIAALFLPSNIREDSLGGMEEIYKKDVKRFGVRKAKWLLAKDIFVSNYPIMKDFLRKTAIKAMKLAGLYEVVRRIIG